MNSQPEDERTSQDDAFLADLYVRVEEEIVPTHPDYAPDEGLERFLTQIGASAEVDGPLDASVEPPATTVPETIPQVTHAQFGEAFTALLEAAGLSVDQLLRGMRGLGDPRLSRAALYDWKRGGHLPSDTGLLLEVVRVCLTAEALWSPQAHPVLFRVGYSMEEAGLVNASLDYWQRVLSTSERMFGPKDSDTLAVRREVAYCHGQAGDPGSAVDELKNLLADHLKTKGPWHPETLRIRRELAWWRGEMRDPVGAVAAYEELLNDMLDVFGPDDYETLIVRYDLGRWRGQSGRPGDAAHDFGELYRDSQDPHLGTSFDDRLILAVRHDLAWWLGESGDAAAAVAEFEKLLSVRQRKLGKDHPFTLATRHDLAWWKWAAGDREEAKSELEKVLDDYELLMEPGHPQTAAVREDLHFLRAEGQHVPHGQVRDTPQRVSGDLPGLDFLRPMDRLADGGSMKA